jgi:hypothetical protein
MALLLNDIGNYLIAHGVVTTGWLLNKSYMADEQDRVIGLFETGGYPAQEMSRSNERLTFQARVRGPRLDYPATRLKWQQVFDTLQDAQEVPGSPILLPGIIFIQALQYGPLALADEKGRPNLVTNFKVMRKLL